MSDPVFGFGIQRIDNEPRPATRSDMATVGLIGPADDADPTTFPLNTPVFLFSTDTTALAALGEAGFLPGTIDQINDQLGELQVAARVVVVRVAEGEDDEETLANIIGNSNLFTGVHAFKRAGALLGVVPRLLAAPGYTHQQESGVASVIITNSGTGYEVGDTIAGTGGGGSGFAATVASVDGDGSILTVTISNSGAGYTGVPTLAVTSDAGEDAAITAVVEKLANPVVAELSAVCAPLLAHAVVSGPHSTLQGWTDWRETINSQRIIPVETWVKTGSPATTTDSVGCVIGIGVRRDHENGGVPYRSWANQPVYGIVGPSRALDFSLVDGATEGQQILLQNGGVILRGEAGVETAIASGGFMYVGTDVATEDTLWQFYSTTRMRDFIHLMFLRTLRGFLGSALTTQTIQAVRNSMEFALRDLKADRAILGYNVGFERDQNTPEELRLGRFTITFQAEETPVLRFIGMRSAKFRPAFEGLLEDLLTQVNEIVL